MRHRILSVTHPAVVRQKKLNFKKMAARSAGISPDFF
jgi:hypothetical protein